MGGCVSSHEYPTIWPRRSKRRGGGGEGSSGSWTRIDVGPSMFKLASSRPASVNARRETLASVDNHRSPAVVPILDQGQRVSVLGLGPAGGGQLVGRSSCSVRTQGLVRRWVAMMRWVVFGVGEGLCCARLDVPVTLKSYVHKVLVLELQVRGLAGHLYRSWLGLP
jgi:hypothetical protein